MGNNAFVSAVLGGNDITIIDVGARYDIPEHWLVLDGVARVVAFEPDHEACDHLRKVYDGRGSGHLYRNLPIAVSGTGGRRKLYVTNTPSGSSLYSPDTAVNRAYVDKDYMFPIRESFVETRRMDDVLDEVGEPRNDMIKIDVEGAALEVLEGLGERRLESVASVEMECGVTQQFAGERTLFDINTFMLEKGFELLDMRKLFARRTRHGKANAYQLEVFGVHADSPTISARLLDVDAMYFRRPETLLGRGAGGVHRLAVAYCTYGYFAEAHALIEEARERGDVTPAAADSALDGVVAWHRHHAVRTVFHRPTPFWRLVRQATKMVGMADVVLDRIALGEGREVLQKVAERARESLGK